MTEAGRRDPARSGRSSFGMRLFAAMNEFGPLCAGIDPHPALLAQAGLPDTPDGLERFAHTILEAVGGRVAAIKPQSAFFERHGSAGIAVLERLLRDCADAGTLSILDVKRGDIGSTMSAYAQAYLVQGAPLAADAVTLTPYLGYESLRPGLDAAAASGRGVFVLALTSNPEGASVQHAGSPSVASRIIDQVSQENRRLGTASEAANSVEITAGHVGLVIGATQAEALRSLGVVEQIAASRALVLAPGVGAQGATAQDIAAAFAGHTDHVVVPVSRALLSDGCAARDIRSAAAVLGEQLSEALQ